MTWNFQAECFFVVLPSLLATFYFLLFYVFFSWSWKISPQHVETISLVCALYFSALNYTSYRSAKITIRHRTNAILTFVLVTSRHHLQRIVIEDNALQCSLNLVLSEQCAQVGNVPYITCTDFQVIGRALNDCTVYHQDVIKGVFL